MAPSVVSEWESDRTKLLLQKMLIQRQQQCGQLVGERPARPVRGLSEKSKWDVGRAWLVGGSKNGDKGTLCKGRKREQ